MVYHVIMLPECPTRLYGIQGALAWLTRLMGKSAYNTLANLAHDLVREETWRSIGFIREPRKKSRDPLFLVGVSTKTCCKAS